MTFITTVFVEGKLEEKTGKKNDGEFEACFLRGAGRLVRMLDRPSLGRAIATSWRCIFLSRWG